MLPYSPAPASPSKTDFESHLLLHSPPQMEIISERERILLGYAPRDHLAGGVLSSQRRNSDVDFQDVFGGPPRRSSMYESGRSQADSIDSVESERSRFGPGEKAVFGDRSGSGRRRHLGDDFYSDIFQSSESACSSPRRGDRDGLMSSPGSRVCSPNRLMGVSGGSCFGQFSLSENMDKGLDHPAFGSQTQHSLYGNEDDRFDASTRPLSPNASSTGPFTTQSVAGHGDLRNNGSSAYRQSPLSRQISSSFEGMPDTMEPAFQSVEGQTGKSSGSLRNYISNQQFHFSIYKWAGKGVTLVLPSHSYELNESEGRITSLPEIIVQEVELPSNCDYFSPVTKDFESGTVVQKKESDKKGDDHIVTAAKGLSHTESGPVLLKDETTKDKCGNQSEKASVPFFDENSNINCANEFKYSANGEQNHELRSLNQLFDDDMVKLGSDDIPSQVKEKVAQTKSQKKQQLQRESRSVPGEVNCSTLHDVPPFLEDKPLRSKVKGKVKEFIKKFNQEGSPKRKGAFEMLARRSKPEEIRIRQDKVDELSRVSSIGADKSQEKSVNSNIPLFDISKENQVIEKGEEDKFGISSDGPSSEERIEVLPPQFEPTADVFNNVRSHEENILEDFEEYLVKQLPANLTEVAQTSPQQDQIKNLDTKIRQWSSRKEGNIRSLLSTLQLVLWEDSGWKPVPLVSIIEGASVKKAYQKALLCLHPDKLQQKGASSNQKYIAEKVFGILQEAWDHFNSISEF